MSEEYRHGKEMGNIEADIKNITNLLETHISQQHEWNKHMETEVNLLKAWVQTTTGKVVILTALFGAVGSVCYIAINWFLNQRQ